MYNITQINSPEQKARICDDILHSLPAWFGIESSIVNYTKEVRELPFWAAFDGEDAIGFIALQIHNPFTSEICVMGIMENHHRHGIGKQLVECCEAFCSANHTEFLTVKTLADTVDNADYAKTREFYTALGFRPIEIFPLHWDKSNPCLFMAKFLRVEQ